MQCLKGNTEIGNCELKLPARRKLREREMWRGERPERQNVCQVSKEQSQQAWLGESASASV